MLRVACLVGATTLALAVSKPHVFLVVGDDIGHFNVGYQGNTEARTPNLDKLAMEGARLERMYAYFWCSPSRASIMSGRIPAHMYQEKAPQASTQDGLPTAVTTLAEKMRAAGYATVQAGKWHLGRSTPGRMPTSRGFDTSLGFLTGAENHLNQSACSDRFCLTATGQGVDGAKLPPGILKNTGIFDLWHNDTAGTPPETGSDKGFGDDRWTDHVIAAVNSTSAGGKPLFAYLALAAAHAPLQAPDEALAPFPTSMYHDRRMYNGLMSALDTNVGRLVAAIQARPGMWDCSLLLFVSDNGGPIYFNNPNITGLPADLRTGGGANNYPLTGGKLSMLEGGVRVVSFAAGGALPPAAQGQTFPQLMALADLHATVVDAGGGTLPDARGEAAGVPPVDGVSLLPVLRGGPGSPSARDSIALALNVSLPALPDVASSALIVGDLKIIVGDQHFYVTPNRTFPTADYAFVWDDAHMLKCGTAGCLFNLTADSAEQDDLAASRPDLLATMQARLAAELVKQWERPTGKVNKLAMLASLVEHKGCLGPFAKDEGLNAYA